MRSRKVLIAGLMVLTLIAAACGGDDDGGGSGGGGGGLGVEAVQLAMDNDDFMNQIAWMVADENYWPDLGFEGPAEVVATDEYIAGLLGGDVWVAQGESDVIWAAMAEGSVELTGIGVEKDTEAWFLGIREGVDPENLAGLKISGGPPGDRNITVGEHILEDLGVDPESMEWVSVDGGSDERLTALIAGQIDVAVLQPRHTLLLEEEGGQMIYEEFNDAPQEVWVVQTSFLEENKDAVCAYMEGRIAAKQWMSEGDDYSDNKDAAVQLGQDHPKGPLDPSEGDLAEWETEMTENWALDGGAPVAGFEAWNQDMIANENVPEDFDWHDHFDFECLWQAQENLGLESNPNPDEL